NAPSVLLMLNPAIFWLYYVMPLLAVGGFALAGLLALRSPGGRQEVGQPAEVPRQEQHASLKPHFTELSTRLSAWWSDLRATPYRCGLVLLLVWQIVPLLILTRHAVDLHAQYFFMLMPGPFILTSLLISKVAEWLGQQRQPSEVMRYGAYA